MNAKKEGKHMNKKAVLLISLLLWILPTLAMAEDYCTAAQLHEQTPEHWVQTYQTAWRDVEIDTHVFTPDVQTMPVITVAYDLNDMASSTGHYKVTRSKSGILHIDIGNIDKQRPNGVFHSAQYFAPYSSASYAPGSSADVDGALQEAENMLNDCQLSAELFDLARPEEVAVWWITDKKRNQIGDCEYSISLKQTINQIPVLGHAFLGMPGSMRNGKGGEYFAEVGATMRYMNNEQASFFGEILYETERIAEDIPLCSFDKIKSALEQEITGGHLRKIYEIELGYVLYNVEGASKDPGSYWRKTAAYYAVPTWFVSCVYLDQAKKAWTPSDDPEQASRSDVHSFVLLIDAQTGKMLPHKKSKQRGAADYRGIITWEDVEQ